MFYSPIHQTKSFIICQHLLSSSYQQLPADVLYIPLKTDQKLAVQKKITIFSIRYRCHRFSLQSNPKEMREDEYSMISDDLSKKN